MQKVIEQTEQLTVFRDESTIKGIIFEQEIDGEKWFSAIHLSRLDGWKWLTESPDREKVFHEAREHFAYHSHECPTCKGCVECAASYKCDDPDKEQLCDECQDGQRTPEDSHLEAEYEAHTEIDQ
jgi:hypothetical protein